MDSVGHEVTDQSLYSVGNARPFWRLKPLPLLRANPQYASRRTTGLQDACVAAISANLHLYTMGELRSLPPHLIQKLVVRIRDDRDYDQNSSEPDATTVWTIAAMCDPDGTAQWDAHRTLSLPADNTLATLPPNDVREDFHHPLIALPMAFGAIHTSHAFLTTLTLSGAVSVNDHSMQALRHCTHLTVLWMNKCTVSDDGIRMLASSLILPGDGDESDGSGMWRLRAWFLAGCSMVSDRSLRSFAKWPGLSLLDLRDTSCTSVALDIGNRETRKAFGGLQPNFQACSESLQPLFRSTQERKDQTGILDDLCDTLLKPDLPEADEDEGRYLVFHLNPGPDPLDEWLHEPPPKVARQSIYAPKSTGAYIPGMGTIYGSGAHDMRGVILSETERKRDKLQWALRFQSHGEDVQRAREAGESDPISWWQKDREEAYAFRKRYWQERKESRGDPSKMYEWKHPHMVGKRFRDDGNSGPSRKRSRTWRVGSKIVAVGEFGLDERLMMVRMVHPEWMRLTWSRGQEEQNMAASQLRTVMRKTKGTMLISQMLGDIEPSSQVPSSQASSHRSSSPMPSSPPSDRLATPSSSPIASHAPLSQSTPLKLSQPKVPPRPSPFAAKAKPSPFAAKPAVASQAPASQVPASQVKRNPFAARPVQVTSTGVRKLDIKKNPFAK